MRNKYLLCLALATVLTLGIMWIVSLSVRKPLPPRPSVVVPSHFFGEVVLHHKDGRQSTYNGRELYQRYFWAGWFACEHAFVLDLDWGESKAWRYRSQGKFDLEAPWIEDAPDEINDARGDGWSNCRVWIETLLLQDSESRLRRMLAQSAKEREECERPTATKSDAMR
jgi:hypothetical protein